MSDDYTDIINMKHHVSEKRTHLSMHERAGQFSPFAALRGFKKIIDDSDFVADQDYYQEYDD